MDKKKKQPRGKVKPVIQGKVEPKKERSGQQPSRALFEDGTYDIEDFHRTFIECEDMTEYDPAIKLCGTWKEWERLKACWPTFNTYIAEWKDELDVKLRSKAGKKIIELMEGDDPKALQSSKWIAEQGWNKRAGAAGRPSKKERSKEAKELAMLASETEEEGKRMLKMIDGGKG